MPRKKSTTRTTNNPPPWGKSEAKRLLRADIEAGVVLPELGATTVFAMRPEFQLYLLKNFKTNLKNLRESIAKGPKQPKPPGWRKSEAKELLREDIIKYPIQYH